MVPLVFGSFQVAKVHGIPIRLHVTLLAMVALLVVQLDWALGIPAGVLLFGSVLLHELGHSLVAQRFGIRIASIDLHLLGGMAMMTRPPSSPKQEILIAAAGPLVSVVLGILFSLGVLLVGFEPPFTGAPGFAQLVTYGALLNLAMAVFNLIPALPMDGGRIFRALLSTRLGALPATRLAARVSRVFAVLFIVAGLWKMGWSLIIIGFLLFMMVANEERVAEAQEALRRSPLARAPLGPFMAMGPLGSQDPVPPEPPAGPIIDVGPSRPRETREVFVDPWGRRYLIVTRLAD